MFKIKKKPSPALYQLTLIIYISVILITWNDIYNVFSKLNTPYLWIAFCFALIYMATAWVFSCNSISIAIFELFYYFSNRRRIISNKHRCNDSDVAAIYLTCNDFNATSIKSILKSNVNKIYIFDDSSRTEFINLIDKFYQLNNNKIVLIRRKNNIGYKAGNLNYGINFVTEKYVAICDADQIISKNFINKAMQYFTDDEIAYVQGMHVSTKNSTDSNLFEKSLSSGINLFWNLVLPLRLSYGFPLFLGHGGIIKTEVIKKIKFPEIVAEDLAFSVEVYEHGFRGVYAFDAISREAFPSSIASFRKRHLKWVRGTAQFLQIYSKKIIHSKKLSKIEKIDIFISLFQLIHSSLLIPFIFASYYVLDTISHDEICAFNAAWGCITKETAISGFILFLAPFFPYGIALLFKPVKFFTFFLLGIGVYVATIPITFYGFFAYLYDRKADFLTTGDTTSKIKFKWWRNPNQFDFIAGEIFIAIALLIIGYYWPSLSILGLAITFLVFPVLMKFNLNIYTLPISLVGPIMCLLGITNSIIYFSKNI